MERSSEFHIGSSLEEASDGDVLLYDRRGRVVGPRRYKFFWVRHWLEVGGLSAVLGVCVWVLAQSIAIAVAVAGISLAFLVFAGKRSQGIERALALVSRGELDEAEAELTRLENKRPQLAQSMFDSQMGVVLWLKGDLRGAIDRLERAHRKEKRAAAQISTAFTLATIYATIGTTEISQAVQETIDRAPNSKLVQIMRAQLDLSRAFHSSGIDSAPDQDALHEIGKLVLTTNLFGGVLVLLAWACTERDDRELAAHWLGEAKLRQRFDLSLYMPKLHEWQAAQEEL